MASDIRASSFILMIRMMSMEQWMTKSVTMTPEEIKRERKLGELQAYLSQLTQLNAQGVNVHGELNAVMDALNKELGLEIKSGLQKKSNNESFWLVDIQGHIKNHSLIAWDSTQNEPVIANSYNPNPVKGTKFTTRQFAVTVREVLNQLAVGKTVHQLCGEYDLDINQVAGAVIFAAHVVSNSTH